MAFGWAKDAWDATGGKVVGAAKGMFKDPDTSSANIEGADQREQMYRRYGAHFGESGFRPAQMNLAQRLQQQAQGKDSLSGKLLAQNTASNVGLLQGQAASAPPSQRGLAARMAIQQSGEMNQAMAGQRAIAGIQERTAANQQLAGMLQGAREQDMAARQKALEMEYQQRAAEMAARSGLAGQPSGMDKFMGGASALGAAAVMMASDENLKSGIKSADKEADSFMSALKAQSYAYKDPEMHGDGRRLGVLAQDLEKSPFGKRAVIDTPHGKMVDVPTLTGALGAALARLNDRTEKLERKAKR